MLDNTCDKDFSLENINKIYKELMKLECTMIRRTISTDNLNYLQYHTHNLNIWAVLLDEDESVTNSSYIRI